MMYKISLGLFIFAMSTLTGCSGSYLSVHTDYLSHKTLASYRVNTPDPLLNNPPFGQRLIISWSLPKSYFSAEHLYLEITIRFRNREEIQERIAILKPHGHCVYALLNQDYLDKRGILTYKVDLIVNGTIIEEWRHQIWTDLIVTAPETPETPVENVPADIDEDPFQN